MTDDENKNKLLVLAALKLLGRTTDYVGLTAYKALKVVLLDAGVVGDYPYNDYKNIDVTASMEFVPPRTTVTVTV